MNVWAMDLETFLLRPAVHAPRAVSLAWDCGNGPTLLHCILERDRFRAVVEEGLTADFIVGANVAYDLGVICREFPDLLSKVWRAYDEHRVWDVEHTEKLCDLHDGKLWWHWDPGHLNKKTKKFGAMVKVSYSLAAIVQRRFGILLDKDTWRLKYGTLADVPCIAWPQGARDYALLDASITYKVWAAQAAEPFSKLVDLTRQARAAWWLHLMVLRGFRVDPVQVERLSVSIRTEREHVAARLMGAGLVRPDGSRDTKAAEARMRAVCAAKNLPLKFTPPSDKFPNGQVQINKETVGDTKDPTLIDYARITSLTSMISGSIVTLQAAARAGMPIQSRFEVVQDTGRTSCSGSRKVKAGQDPYETAYAVQLQNVRRNILDEDGEEIPGVRECFVSRDGFVLCSNDYGQLELCTWAQACLDLDCGSAMADALNKGLDVHCLLGGLLVGRPYEEIYAARKKEIWARDARQSAKIGNFSLPGGMGARGIAGFAKAQYGVVWTEQEALALINVWKRMWPEQEKYFRFIRNCVGPAQEGAIVQLRSWRRRGGCGYTDGANCVDYETEALTERGWVRGPDLLKTDRLLTKNAETGRLEWQKARAVHLYPDRVGPLVEFKTTRFSAVTTPNHRWLVFDKGTRTNICTTSEKISRYGDHRIHRTGQYEEPDAEAYSDDFLELVGWVLTDGSYGKGTQTLIHQTKRHTAKLIDALFSRLGTHFSRRVRSERGAVVWTFTDKPLHRTGQSQAARAICSGVTGYTFDDYQKGGIGIDPDSTVAVRLGVSLQRVGQVRRAHGLAKPVPPSKGYAKRLRDLFPNRLLTSEFVALLSARQARLLFNTMMLGDGTVAKAGKGQQKFFTRSESAASSFQMLCTLAGYASKLEWRDMRKYNGGRQFASMKNVPKMTGIWTVSIYRRDKVQVLKHQVREFVEARGVWCPEVPNTYFVARRAGTVYVTGNTLFQGLAADLAKEAGYEISKACYLDQSSPLYGSRIVNFVHDEFIMELPEDRAHAAAKESQRIMEAVGRKWCPDVPPKAEPALMRRWYKGAEPKFENGILVPWEPRPTA